MLFDVALSGCDVSNDGGAGGNKVMRRLNSLPAMAWRAALESSPRALDACHTVGTARDADTPSAQHRDGRTVLAVNESLAGAGRDRV